jgi:hypothetical protein
MGQEPMEIQQALWCTAAALLALAAGAAVAEHRRTRRRDLDKVGWMPWNAIQVLAFFAAVGAAVLAMRG